MGVPVPPSEVIVICVDNSRWMMPPDKFDAQWVALKHYCEAKFAEHQDTVVGLFTLSSFGSEFLLHPPTRNLKKILDCFHRVWPDEEAELDLLCALQFAPVPLLSHKLPDKKLRILFFVGGLTNMSLKYAGEFGKEFIDWGIAVDIVNYYLSEFPKKDDIQDGFYPFGRRELRYFFDICNHDGNSHFVDVEPESDVCQLISDSMFKKKPCLSEEGSGSNVEGKELPRKNEGASDSTFDTTP